MCANVRIIQDEDEKELVIIDEIIFRNRQKIDWKAVEIYLKKYVGQLVEVAATKETIRVKANFPDEYAGSIYTKKLRGSRVKAKANLSQGILQAIQIAKKIIVADNKKQRHKNQAHYGWHYYETRFALPIYHEESNEIRHCLEINFTYITL